MLVDISYKVVVTTTIEVNTEDIEEIKDAVRDELRYLGIETDDFVEATNSETNEVIMDWED